MSDDPIPVEDEVEEAAKTATDRVSVAGGDLIKTVQSLLREAAVRRITIQDKNGRTLVEIPLYAGVVGAVFMGAWTVLALIAAWFAEVSILIERDLDSDREPSVVGEAVDRAAAGVSARAAAATEAARAGLAGVVGSAAGAVGGAAQAVSRYTGRAADSIEERMDAGKSAADAIIEAAESAEPRRCAALTKSGERCKRNAAAGSAYCSTHQPK